MVDWREYVWKLLFGPLNSLASMVGLYTSTRTGRDEYVGTVRESEPAVEETLRDLGLARSLLSSLHERKTPLGFQGEDAAFVWRPWLFSRYQVHILIFAGYDGTTDVYAHYERNPWRSPLAHYAGDDLDAGLGRHYAKKIIWNQLTWLDGPFGATQPDGAGPYDVDRDGDLDSGSGSE